MTMIHFYKKYWYENFDKYPDEYEYETGVAKVVSRIDGIGKALELYTEGSAVDLSKHGYAGYRISDSEGIYFELWFDGEPSENGITVYLEAKKGDESRTIQIASGDNEPSYQPIVTIYYEKTGEVRRFHCVMIDLFFLAFLVTSDGVYVYAETVYDLDAGVYISEERKWVKLIDVDIDYCNNVVFWLRKRRYDVDEICHGCFAWTPQEAFMRGFLDALMQLLPILILILFIVILVEVFRW